MTRFSQFRYRMPPNPGQPGGLLGRALAFVVGLGVLAVSVFLGAIFFVSLLGFVLIVAIVVMVRVWWLKRKMQSYAQQHGDIDAEYTVVMEDRKEFHRQSNRQSTHQSKRQVNQQSNKNDL
jgi:predicted lipid-binding transport protein (Tim44 family)